MAAQRLLDQCSLELRHLIGQRPRRRMQSLKQLELFPQESEHETVGNVVQFAYVARPGVRHQFRKLRARHDRRLAFIPRSRIEHKMLEQGRDILAPLAQRR